mgnify:FL=1
MVAPFSCMQVAYKTKQQKEKNMSINYAVMQVSKLQDNYVLQTVWANIDQEVVMWYRKTNGKQGSSNSWERTATWVPEDITHQVGEIVASTITPNDIETMNNKEFPKVLFQKLLRNHSLRSQEETEIDYPTLMNTIRLHADSFEQYHKDFRQERSGKPKENHMDTKTDPVIVIDRQAPSLTENALSFVTANSVAGYVQRKFAGDITEKRIFDFALHHKLNVLIEGEAGTGKTSSVMNYAHKMNLPFYSLSSNISLEPTQIFGTMLPTPDGKWAWQDGGLTQIVRHGGVLLINEGNFLPARIATVLYSLLDYRRQITLMDKGNEVVTAHPNLLIVTDMNMNYRGTSQLNEAWADRFAIKLRYEYDNKIEKKFITSEALLDLATSMRIASKGREVTTAPAEGIAFETPISTRLLKTFELIAKELSYEFAVENFVNNFAEEERSSVRLLLESNESNLRSDYNLSNETITTDLGVDNE